MSLTEGLVKRIGRPIGDDERALAALHVLDWVAASVAALDCPEGRVLTALGEPEGLGPAGAIGVGPRDARMAALVNGGLALALELDSTHRAAKLHPGPVVIAAALAASERGQVKGRAFLDAVIAGYEVMVRIGESVGPDHYRRYHSTATCGPFGAAAAAGTVIGLDPEQLADALGNAGSRTGGLWQCRVEHAMSKPLHAGGAAEGGLLAADLAARGLTGPREILEGSLGFYAAACPDADPSRIWREDGSAWKISETSLKPWPGCRHIHPAIGAALELRDAGTTEGVWGHPSSVSVATYPDALTFADDPDPADPHAAMFSIQHCVAVALLDGEVTLASFDKGRIDADEVAELRMRVRVRVGERFTDRYPDHWGAEVSVAGSEGETTRVCHDAKGDPEAPLSARDVHAKASELLASAGADESARDRLFKAVDTLVNDGPVSALSEALQDFRADLRPQSRSISSTRYPSGSRTKHSREPPSRTE